MDEDDYMEKRRFMAVCWGPGEQATTAVMLDHEGQLVDILFASQLSGLIRRTRVTDDPFQDPAKVCAQLSLITPLSLGL